MDLLSLIHHVVEVILQTNATRCVHSKGCVPAEGVHDQGVSAFGRAQSCAWPSVWLFLSELSRSAINPGSQTRDAENNTMNTTIKNALQQIPEAEADLLDETVPVAKIGIAPGRMLVEEGADANAYTAVNVLTRVATHYLVVPSRQRLMLARLAGLISFRRSHCCSRCFSLLSDAVPYGESARSGGPD